MDIIHGLPIIYSKDEEREREKDIEKEMEREREIDRERERERATNNIMCDKKRWTKNVT